MTHRIIDPDTWYRRGAYRMFIGCSAPSVSITTRVDVTNLYDHCERNGVSFFICFLYNITRSFNTVDEARTRIVGDRIVQYDSIDPAFVVLREDGSITNARIEMTDDFAEFYTKVREAIAKAKRYESEFLPRFTNNNVYYFSNTPWMDFTAISHPYNYDDKDSTSVPRATWGKIVEKDGRRTVALNVSFNHALIDGHHIHMAISTLQDALDDLHLIDPVARP